MKASSIVLLTAVLVLLGRWSQGKKADAKVIVGGLFAALVISIMDNAQPKLAKGFAYLFLTGAVLTYLAPLLANTTQTSSAPIFGPPAPRR